jgi:hypothetical protein
VLVSNRQAIEGALHRDRSFAVVGERKLYKSVSLAAIVVWAQIVPVGVAVEVAGWQSASKATTCQRVGEKRVLKKDFGTSSKCPFWLV